jgi:hypothetical protein
MRITDENLISRAAKHGKANRLVLDLWKRLRFCEPNCPTSYSYRLLVQKIDGFMSK